MELRRTEKGVNRHTLLNLGVNFSLPREQWPKLAKRIEEILGAQHSFIEIDYEVERLPQRYGSNLVLLQQDVTAEIATHGCLQERSSLGELLDYAFDKLSQYTIAVEKGEKSGNAGKITWHQQPSPDTRSKQQYDTKQKK